MATKNNTAADNDAEHVILKLEGADAQRFRAFKKKTFITSNVGAARKIIVERLDKEDRATDEPQAA